MTMKSKNSTKNTLTGSNNTTTVGSCNTDYGTFYTGDSIAYPSLPVQTHTPFTPNNNVKVVGTPMWDEIGVIKSLFTIAAPAITVGNLELELKYHRKNSINNNLVLKSYSSRLEEIIKLNTSLQDADGFCILLAPKTEKVGKMTYICSLKQLKFLGMEVNTESISLTYTFEDLVMEEEAKVLWESQNYK